MMTRTYTSAAQDAATIRAAIKERWGLSSRQVSVRAEEYSMGSSVNVRVKAAGAPLAAIEELARSVAERIRRDDATGEILSGGNRFVFVEWLGDLVRRVERPLRARLERLPVGSSVAPVPGVAVVRSERLNYEVIFESNDDAEPVEWLEAAVRRLALHLLSATPHAAAVADAIGAGVAFKRLPATA
jgi:hypothetical protein